MINSRDLKELNPKVKERVEKWLAACKAEGIDVLITSTYRDAESQNALYAQGRTKPGRIVTNAKAGDSWHNWRCAVDFVPMRNGKPVWGTSGNGLDNNPADDETDDLELWQKIGTLAEKHGLEWAGRWKKFKELAHVQYTAGLTLADFKAGKTF